ncbi:MAG: DNA-binding protein WhiA [Actinomyces sp.]|jgi:DNA-binding protein WhiA|nr:DNA-binding protein WhiA [Actinomyces sp.]MCI1642020.1 DNA-binding protein WhiA [Actinomyces sp.]MCI1663020.1 DNA-binding protein WhiA [Actinomyces sp.]MCI1691916.1 DNA-binding protein WhiA [Actinomyces sp.]MCI1788721.1 DNA-binding protein WhiA [Actinomyces sp.]MCI1831105.1 DNA-binding protein WhiA [Actinomyces sp.]
MSLTTDMKDELARQRAGSAGVVASEVAATLRFAGGLHLVSGRVIVEAELDSAVTAARLRAFIAHLYGAESSVVVVTGGALRRGDRYVVRVVRDADNLARMTGLIDQLGRPVRGLPAQIVASGPGEAAAAWRGAFLARGSLMEPGRSSSLEITCPGPEAALALVGCARRLGAAARSKEVRGADRVTVRDSEAIGVLIASMGAARTHEVWQSRRERREARGSANRLANFDDANLRRSARAAVAAGARVERAFEILGGDIPAHLREAGDLRLQFRQASLEELGKRTDPPLTKDAVAGRIRRLLAMADKAAHERGIPDTEAVLTLDMLEDD